MRVRCPGRQMVSRKSPIRRWRSSSDSLASLCRRSISSGVGPRLATAVSTARRRRRMRICTSSASACAAATAGSGSSRCTTFRMAGRSTPSSRSVRTRSRRATAIQVVKAVASRAAASRRHDPAVGVEPDGPDRQPGPPGEVADSVEPVAVHIPTLASPPTGDSSPCPSPCQHDATHLQVRPLGITGFPRQRHRPGSQRHGGLILISRASRRREGPQRRPCRRSTAPAR